MAPSAVRIFGYAIISLDGMIADVDGRMTETLIIEADQIFYEASLARARLVVHGRNSAEPGSEATTRRRVIATTRVDALSATPDARIWLWNPLGLRFAEVLQTLGVTDGIIAVVGGTDVFDLFLGIGYDAFYLSRSARGALPGGRPLFRQVPEKSPEDILSAAGLRLCAERVLEPGLTLATWERAPTT